MIDNRMKELLEAYDDGACAVIRGLSLGIDTVYAGSDTISKESILTILDQTYAAIKTMIDGELSGE